MLLETDPIERITPAGCAPQSGTEHDVDVLVLATGFKVFDSGNLPKYPVTGRGGVDLEQWWDENRYQAYEGVSVPGFPNYFTMFGPYGYNGASYFNLIETQSRHIVRCPRPRALARTRRLIEVTRRGERPLLRGDAPQARPPDLLAGELRLGEQLLLRPARRRAAPAEPRRSRRCGARGGSRSATTGLERAPAASPAPALASSAI